MAKDTAALVERVKRLDRLYLEALAASNQIWSENDPKRRASLRRHAAACWREYQAACKSRKGLPR